MPRALVDALIEVYESRFGAMAPDLRAVIQATHDEAILRPWLKLVGARSAQEIAAAVHGSRAS